MQSKDKMMKKVPYKCQCGHAVVVDNYFPDEPIIPALQCVNCRGGFGMSIADAIQHRKGLFPVAEAELYAI